MLSCIEIVEKVLSLHQLQQPTTTTTKNYFSHWYVTQENIEKFKSN